VLRNLTGIRLLDRRGAVIASPTHETGYSLAHLAEVQAALEGRYQPALRERGLHGQGGRLSRTNTVRLSIALPIYADPLAPAGSRGPVIGAVYNSRTPLDAERSLWEIRQELFATGSISVLFTVVVVAALTAAIARPLSRLRRAAEAVAAGRSGVELETRGFAPQEVHALAASLSRMRDQLQARAEYVQTFAANAAHELKTPLTSLRGAAELLLDGGEMPAAQRRKFLENIHADALRMDRLVQRILHLARIEARPPAREPIDLEAYLRGVVERWARRGVVVRLTYAAAVKRANLEAEQLESLFGNLLDNAARHGAGEPIDLSVREAAGWLVLAVRDFGPPVPEGQLDRVFERFYSTERGRGGTGLGLAIVRAIAEANGGIARAVRQERGATFEVRLPIDRLLPETH
jgi:two-component system sensor histidine kinase ChvG